MNFPPDNQADFEELAKEYSGEENTACLFASVKNGDSPNQGIIGDMMAVMVLLVMLIQQIANSTGSDFSDILGALAEISSMDTT